MDQPVSMMASGGANVIQQTKLIQGFQVLMLAMSFVCWPSGTGRRYSADACPGLRKPRIEGGCMRVPGGSVLGYPGGSLHTLSVSLSLSLSLVSSSVGQGDVCLRFWSSWLCPPSGALLHDGMLARQSIQPMQLSPGETATSRGPWPRFWRGCNPWMTCVPCRCRCRCNVPVGANLGGLPHALALCYRHHSDMESSTQLSICMLHRTEPCL